MVQKRLSIHGQSPLNRFFLSHLTLLFSIQSTFRERRFTIHLKYFLQIYPLKFGGFKKKQYLCTRLRKPSYSHPDRIWRDGRVVDYNGLENRRTERYRGFESLSLRKSLLKEISEGFFHFHTFTIKKLIILSQSQKSAQNQLLKCERRFLQPNRTT